MANCGYISMARHSSRVTESRAIAGFFSLGAKKVT
jgi:hypothetical protein